MNQPEFEARRCPYESGKHFVTSNWESTLQTLFNFSSTLKLQIKTRAKFPEFRSWRDSETKQARAPFLESPGNFSSPKSNIQTEI